MELVTLRTFEEAVTSGGARDLDVGYNRIIFTNAAGNRCLLDGIKIDVVEDSLVISDEDDKISIPDPDYESKKIERASKEKSDTIGGCIVLPLVLVAVVTFTVFFKPSSGRSIESGKEIQELSEIQGSLKNLDIYIEGQKEELSEVDRTLKALKSEKTKTEEILKLTSPQVIAIQESLGRQRLRDKWIDIGLGILIGIISSSIAHLIMRWFAKRQTKKNDKES